MPGAGYMLVSPDGEPYDARDASPAEDRELNVQVTREPDPDIPGAYRTSQVTETHPNGKTVTTNFTYVTEA